MNSFCQNHRIYARHSGVDAASRLSIPLIKRCVRITLRLEGVDMPCEVSALITDDRRLRELNCEFRGIDKPTDVLSFPMLEFSPPGWATPGDEAVDRETGLLPLGEIIISAERIDRQAREYGQTRERETAYIVVHSVLHLLGYDHIDEAEEKKRMRGREKEILEHISI